MTGADSGERLRALECAAVWDLCVLAVIRPHRDGWLIFKRGGYGWCATPEAAADALLAGEHRDRIPIGLS